MMALCSAQPSKSPLIDSNSKDSRTMNPTHGSSIEQLYYHFKAHGKVAFRHCSTDTMRPSLHRVSFEMKDAAGKTLMNVTLEMELDQIRLRSALNVIDPNNLLNILDNDKKMDGFMEQKAFEVIRLLRSFNGMADDYPAIAALVLSVHGAVHAPRYGV